MKISPEVEKFRIRSGAYYSEPNDKFGAFRIAGPCGRDLLVIASSGDVSVGITWEHVSVSAQKYCPTWREMCFIKDLFWDEEETVMQLHPPKSRWINNHATCLHMWKPLEAEIPLPPDITVGNKELGTLT
jgi:hypothetical protein